MRAMVFLEKAMVFPDSKAVANKILTLIPLRILSTEGAAVLPRPKIQSIPPTQVKVIRSIPLVAAKVIRSIPSVAAKVKLI